MEPIEKLDIYLRFTNSPVAVGQMVSDNGAVFFKYDDTFIETGLDISPFKLKRSNAILTPETTIFDGLFGVFNDSLPDGWGRLLLDRTLLSKRIPLNQITPLHRLAYVGSGGMGALTYKPNLNSEVQTDTLLELDEISQEMTKVLEGTPSDVIEELFHLGGSSGGARPKIFVGYNPKTNHLIHGYSSLPEDYEHWIIKFPSSTDMHDIAQIEYAYYKMALAAGIEMSECKLFEGPSGKKYFATKRFDRIHNDRLHLHSVSGLLNDNFRYSNLDYGNIMDCAFRLENHVAAYSKVLRLAAFNVYSHNRDDHSKNISFLMNTAGVWKLAPAYDLTFSNSSHGMHSTMVAGESKAPGEQHLLELANTFEIKHAKTIINEVKSAISDWRIYAKNSEVSNNSKKLIDKTLMEISKS
ncbi:type II toxin-antitoxin system HipA family toxin [Flavivirga eckloniae]|uniref:Type II toxin-antitoxin system HipA family toxin n=1 Tax=Flavivirga eckloniae TaxID=1803846 RepID=A0A2K9PQ78_9FLAO|nr:type II toxin-antitoxin system HipA family toxin [Flavivirga eckloniae]AUP79195.1 type II toxin-antitoxin system HipA family toxin [Flavivirga eckloniae]